MTKQRFEHAGEVSISIDGEHLAMHTELVPSHKLRPRQVDPATIDKRRKRNKQARKMRRKARS